MSEKENTHTSILWIVRTVFFAMFIYSAYKKLHFALSTTEKQSNERSFELIPDKGILGTVKELLKASR